MRGQRCALALIISRFLRRSSPSWRFARFLSLASSRFVFAASSHGRELLTRALQARAGLRLCFMLDALAPPCLSAIVGRNAMKRAFEVLRDRPRLQIRVTRDSVCAGDDCDAPHENIVSVHSVVNPTALVSHLASGYLPTVSGIGHTWDCLLNGQLIASVSVGGISPRVTEVMFAEKNDVHFAYHAATY